MKRICRMLGNKILKRNRLLKTADSFLPVNILMVYGSDSHEKSALPSFKPVTTSAIRFLASSEVVHP